MAGFPRRRFVLACAVPFACVFGATLLRSNAMFALDGMINHTAVDLNSNMINNRYHQKEEEAVLNTSTSDTCIAMSSSQSGRLPAVPDGPFPWGDDIEALINLMVAVGAMLGTLLTLLAYSYLDGRCVYAVCLGFAGLLNVLTPPFAEEGGFYTVVIFRFFTGLYTAMLSPAITVLIQNWFLDNELCRMNAVVFFGVEFGRICFFLSGFILSSPHLGWKSLFYLPGSLCIFLGLLYFTVITDDPLDNSFLTLTEKQLLTQEQDRLTNRQLTNQENQPNIRTNLRLYGKNIRLMKKKAEIPSPPYLRILTHLPFLLATAQYTATTWSNPLRILMMKKYLLAMHGYSLKEAAIMVTLPTNVSQILIGYLAASVGDWATRRNIPPRQTRRISACVCALAILPYMVLPFLPCWLINYRASIVMVQVLGSLKVAGNQAGYMSFRDISPTYNGQLFCLASLVASALPYILVPLFMGWFTTATRHNWQANFVLNGAIILTGNLLYCLMVPIQQASWDPRQEEEENEKQDLDKEELWRHQYCDTRSLTSLEHGAVTRRLQRGTTTPTHS